MNDYIPSAADAPNGPRNNRDELDEIRKRGDEFAKGQGPEPVEVDDPFSKDNVGAFLLIEVMRLYDVQMALLNETNHEAATMLSELHAQGKLIGSFPWINGED